MAKSFWLISAGMAALATPAYAQDNSGPTQSTPSGTENGSVQGNTVAASQAQTSSTDTSNGADIIVTAQGRRQILEDVPLAVSAISAEALQNSGANDIRQLNQVAPSLLVSSTGSEANASARIRGVGTVGDNPGLESSVGVFIDGVYRSRTGIGLNDLGELERIEVLRGPQGTLFGRNTSAGLINIITASPNQNRLEAYGELTYGNYNYWHASGGVTGPIGSSGLAFRLDGVWSRRDGFYHDNTTGEDVNNRDRYLIRGQLTYEPNSNLRIRLIGDYSHRHESCCAAVYASTGIAPANAGLISTSNPIVPVLLDITGASFNTYFPAANDPYNRQIATTPGRNYDGITEDYGVSGQIDWTFGNTQLTSITAWRHYNSTQAGDIDYGLADLLYDGPDNGRSFETFSQEVRLHGQAFDNRLDWLIGGYYAHEDLTAVSQLNFGSQYGRFAACRLVTTVALANPAFGAFFSPGSTGCLSPTGEAVLRGVVPGVPSPFGAAGPGLVAGFNLLDRVNNVGDNDADYFQRSQNFALFTHNIIHITPALDLTLGLRYTDETKHFSAAFNNTNTFCPAEQAALLPFLGNPGLAPIAGGLIQLACVGNSTSQLNGMTLPDSTHEDRFSGTAVLSWHPRPGILVYGSYSRGYKAGGYNLDRSALTIGPGSITFPITDPRSGFAVTNLRFSPETVNAYELGFKFERSHFVLNAALFREEFTNFQLNTFNGTVFIVQNINGCSSGLSASGTCASGDISPGVVAQGLELESSFQPARYLAVNLGATFSDTRYAHRLVGSDTGRPLDPALSRLPGQLISNAPPIVVTGSMTWTPPIAGTQLSGLVYVDARLTSDFNTGSDLAPEKIQNAFVLVNARLGIRGPGGRWSFELWGQNLFNQGYIQVGFESPLQAPEQIYSAFLAEPRTYGVTARFHF